TLVTANPQQCRHPCRPGALFAGARPDNIKKGAPSPEDSTMPSPFPGMDPYLEARRLWRSVHLGLIYNIAADLQPQLVPRYVARPEERVLLAPLDEPLEPDVNIREREASPGGGVQLLARPASTDAASPEIIEVPDLTIPHRFVEIRDP